MTFVTQHHALHLHLTKLVPGSYHIILMGLVLNLLLFKIHSELANCVFSLLQVGALASQYRIVHYHHQSLHQLPYLPHYPFQRLYLPQQVRYFAGYVMDRIVIVLVRLSAKAM
jgi:hypothetical protein